MRMVAHRDTATLIAHSVKPTSSWWVCSTDEAFVQALQRELPRMLSARLSPKLEAALNAVDYSTQRRMSAVR